MTNEFWTITATIVSILSLALAAYIYYKSPSRRGKKLTVHTWPPSILPKTAARSGGKLLQVSYGGDLVKNFAISRFGVANTGALPIVQDDFEKAVVIKYDDIDKIYYSECITVARSKGLSPLVTLEKNQIIIAPLLLNPGDSFVIETGIDLKDLQTHPMISAQARIAGVSKVIVTSDLDRKQSLTSRSLVILEGILAALITLALLILIIFRAFPVPPKP